MKTDHSITWKIDPWGIRGSVTCSASKGADCRKKCSGDCDWWSENWDDGCCIACGSKIVDAGHCMMLPWIDSGPEEFYSGTDHPVTDGPIELEWEESFGVRWRYSGEATND